MYTKFIDAIVNYFVNRFDSKWGGVFAAVFVGVFWSVLLVTGYGLIALSIRMFGPDATWQVLGIGMIIFVVGFMAYMLVVLPKLDEREQLSVEDDDTQEYKPFTGGE